MTNYEDQVRKLKNFLRENPDINPCDLNRLSRLLYRCGTCKFFVRHYNSKGLPIDYGHCPRTKIIKTKKPGENACGFWKDANE